MPRRLSLFFVFLLIFSLSGICIAAPISIEELLKKAESGDPNSQLTLAKRYFDGRRGTVQDYNEAVKWFRKAAEQGFTEAQNYLGRMYYNGYGVQQDYNEAVNWVTKAATQGYAKAQYDLGLMCYEGKGIPQDYKDAVKWYTKAAEQGYAGAQLNLGLMYYFGDGVSRNYEDAAKWFTKAAMQGVPEAQFQLAVMHSEGKGVSEDYKTAAQWYTKAATQGIPEAQFNLGVIYCNGEGVGRNYKAASNWFLKAAAQGIVKAQLILGIMYREGEGVSKNYIESYKWFLIAETNGDRIAKRFRESLGEEMTPGQLDEAQQRTNRLKNTKGFITERKEDSEKNKRIAGGTKSSATGFFITSDGFILTACHAVDETEKIEVLYNQKRYAARVVRKDTSNDIAVLKIEDNNLPFLSIVSSSAVKLGDAVFTIGYPRTTVQGSDPKYTEGSVSSLSGLNNDSKCFQISVPVQPGNSGGPLVNEKGEVVGIITSKLNDIAILLITGSIPQNVNYALKSSFALSFIESIPDLSQKFTAPNPAKNRPAAIEQTEKSIVVIVGYD
ncbi:MAG: trypsin-like peptidase domain-containing protein [Phycisphaerae bacterium]|nr:trypsin-like peptidase domain-containing protein [Phycisphaerae bacterium]